MACYRGHKFYITFRFCEISVIINISLQSYRSGIYIYIRVHVHSYISVLVNISDLLVHKFTASISLFIVYGRQIRLTLNVQHDKMY